MKSLQKYISAMLVAFLLVGTSACDFGDTNIDPESLVEGDVEVNLVMPSALVQTAFNLGAIASRNPGIVMQYFEGTDAQQLQYTTYVMADNTFNNLWRLGAYGGAMKDIKFIMDRAEAEGFNHYSGVAKILMAVNLGMLTNFFGDIPYSEAFQGFDGNVQPAYDSQEQIYATINTLLTEAIADLGGEAGALGLGSDDRIYAGSAAGWQKTAYALRARYTLQQSKRDASAYASALADLGNAYTSNADNAVLYFDNTATGAHPLWQFESQRSGTMVLASYFLGVISGDPREDLIKQSGTANRFSPSTYWGEQTSGVNLINFAECEFMRAEILLQQSDAAGATDALQSAVTANMQEMGASGYAGYVAALDGSSLENIINEKYIGLYPSFQSWNDYRRTGFPSITPPANADLGNLGTSTAVIPERFLYPFSERDLNSENLASAITNQGGSDLMGMPLWAFED